MRRLLRPASARVRQRIAPVLRSLTSPGPCGAGHTAVGRCVIEPTLAAICDTWTAEPYGAVGVLLDRTGKIGRCGAGEAQAIAPDQCTLAGSEGCRMAVSLGGRAARAPALADSGGSHEGDLALEQQHAAHGRTDPSSARRTASLHGAALLRAFGARRVSAAVCLAFYASWRVAQGEREAT